MPAAALWESQDPRSQRWMTYSAEHNTKLEAAFQNPNKPDVEIDLGGHPFTVSVKSMTQTNAKGFGRPIRRSDASRLPVCKYFAAGNCKSGDKCTYPHSGGATSSSSGGGGGGGAASKPTAADSDSDDDDATSHFVGPPKEQTHIIHATPCRYFLDGNCKAGNKCPYPHVTQEEANQAPGLLYALIPCRWHKKSSGCSNGAVCPFKHDGPSGAATASSPGPGSSSTSSTTTYHSTPGGGSTHTTTTTTTSYSSSSSTTTGGSFSMLPPSLTPCRFWAAHNCPWGSRCIYSHDGPGGPSSSAGTNTFSNTPCTMWGLGKCNKGDRCKWKHEGASGSKIPAKPHQAPAGSGGSGGSGAADSASFQAHDPTGTGRCRSLFIGINYPGTDAALSGCVNDVRTMLKVLDEFHGFNLDDKRILVDEKGFAGRFGQPNKKNILDGFKWLVDGAVAGDTLFLHYSGHGCRVPDQDGDEDDGQDEALCPSDYKKSYVIVDDIVFDLLCRKLPSGVRLTAVMDCCHSGSMMDLEWSYTTKLDRHNKLNGEFTKVSKKHCNADVILFSGCKDTQTSADVSSTAGFKHGAGDPGKAGGACTNALAEVLWSSGPTPGDVHVSYIELLDKMREILKRRRFTQIPQISCSKPCDVDRHFSVTGKIGDSKK